MVLAKEWKKNGLTEGRKNYMKSTIKLEHICSYKHANIKHSSLIHVSLKIIVFKDSNDAIMVIL